jgi:hypothetical protein
MLGTCLCAGIPIESKKQPRPLYAFRVILLISRYAYAAYSTVILFPFKKTFFSPVSAALMYLEETRLAMVSVPGSEILAKIKTKSRIFDIGHSSSRIVSEYTIAKRRKTS